MRTATLAKLALTATVGLGTLVNLAGPVQAETPQQGTLVLDQKAPPTTSTTLVLQAEEVDPTPDLPLANPSQDPAVDPEEPGGEPDPQPEASCAPTPGGPDECDDTPDPDCVPDSTQQDPWSHCDEDDCTPTPGGPDPCPGEECPEPESDGPSAAHAQIPPPTVPDPCEDPGCPETDDGPTRHRGEEPDPCEDPGCPETDDGPTRHRGEEPDPCEDPGCPETDDGPTRHRGEERPEDCDEDEPCIPKPGEDESCRLPKTGVEMSTYVAAGAGLTGFGAALKGLQRALRRRRP